MEESKIMNPEGNKRHQPQKAGLLNESPVTEPYQAPGESVASHVAGLKIPGLLHSQVIV